MNDTLQKFSKYAPTMTVLALVALAMFNIGYFWVIGLHFIGLVDLSNIVYSLAIALTLVVGFGPVGAMLMDFKSPQPTKKSAARIASLTGPIFGLGGATALMSVASPVVLPEFVVVLLLLVGFTLITGICAAQVWLSSQTGQKIPTNFLAGFIVGLCGLIAAFGALTGEVSKYGGDSYEITTKSDTVSGRILRSASAGFIIFSSKSVVFLPSAEVVRIVKK